MIRLGLPCPRSVQARCVPSGESEVSPTVSTLPRSARIARTFAFAGGCVSGEAARAGKASAGKQSVATQNRADKARRDTELMRRMLTVFAPAGRARGPWRGTAYGSLGTLRQGRQIALPRSALDQRSRRKSGSPGSFTGNGPYIDGPYIYESEQRRRRAEGLFHAKLCSDASRKAVFVHNFNAFY